MIPSEKADISNGHNWLWDLPVISFVLISVVWPIFIGLFNNNESLNAAKNIINPFIGISGNLFLLLWVTIGQGFKSQLWNWLPPFWPIGKIFFKPKARKIVVLLIFLGSVLGFLSEYRIINIKPQY